MQDASKTLWGFFQQEGASQWSRASFYRETQWHVHVSETMNRAIYAQGSQLAWLAGEAPKSVFQEPVLSVGKPKIG